MNKRSTAVSVFEQKLECALAGIAETLQGKHILAAVSGGADSIAMLTGLHHLGKKFQYAVHVVTVNHNIRPAAESAADAAYVADYCRTLGNIPCTVKTVPAGQIRELAAKRKRGTEEAARFVRYGYFMAEAEKIAAAAVCIAHTRNDLLETVVQRFLQGGSGAQQQGIPKQRGILFRPLLDISRDEVVAYLDAQHIPYRTDCTNFDDAYLRNRIRNRILPVLDEYVPGWQTAVLHGVEKAAADASFIDSIAAQFPWRTAERADTADSGAGGISAVRMNAGVFRAQPEAVRLRLLCRGLSESGYSGRIPYAVLKQFLRTGQPVVVDGIQFFSTENEIFIDSADKNRTNTCSFAIIESPGVYSFGSRTIRVCAAIEKSETNTCFGPYTLPVSVRLGTAVEIQAIGKKNDAAGEPVWLLCDKD